MHDHVKANIIKINCSWKGSNKKVEFKNSHYGLSRPRKVRSRSLYEQFVNILQTNFEIMKNKFKILNISFKLFG